MTEPTAERIADVSTVRPDPIGCDFSLPLKAVFHPLGFPVEIATNCAEVLAAAEENWKSFDNVFSAVPVQLHIAVSKGHASECPPPPTYRGQRNLVMFVALVASVPLRFSQGGRYRGLSDLIRTPLVCRQWRNGHLAALGVRDEFKPTEGTAIHDIRTHRVGVLNPTSTGLS